MECTVHGGMHFPGALLVTAGAWLVPGAVHAIDIQGILPAAFDQPQINVAVEVNGQIRNDFFGALSPMTAFLDTGASGILISSMWADSVLELDRAMHNGQPVRFGDVGVGGSEFFDVSEAITLHIAPYAGDVDPYVYDPEVYNQTLPQVRTQIGGRLNDIYDPIQWLLSQLNVVGMPAMQGKVVVMDPKPVNDVLPVLSGEVDIFDLIEITMRTHVYDKPAPSQSNPNIPLTDRTIKLSYGTFDAFTVTTPDGAPGPNLAHNPFVTQLAANGSAGSADVLFKLGNIAYKRGDRAAALNYWRETVEADPDHAVARTNLELVGSALSSSSR